MFPTMRLPGMCILPSARTCAGGAVLRPRRNGCTKGKDLIVHVFWTAASLQDRSRNFLPLMVTRPLDIKPREKLVELTYTAAFLAGMISFLSPCVLPLVPGFVGTMTGLSAEQLQEDGSWHWRAILLNSFLFVLGFSVLFISLGASAGTVGRFLSAHRDWLNRIAGAGIVFFGLVLLRLLPFKFLNRDMRFHREIRQGKLRSFLLGLAFAFGWTPCAGPALAAMLRRGELSGLPRDACVASRTIWPAEEQWFPPAAAEPFPLFQIPNSIGGKGFCLKSKQSDISSEAASLALTGFNPNVTSQNFTRLTCE